LKAGTLRKTTYIYTNSALTLKVRKGTKVVVENNVLRFNPIEHVEVRRVGGRYYVSLWGNTFLVRFPKGGSAPYPLSML